jgi:membrane protein DedA with SNARE-associated domain
MQQLVAFLVDTIGALGYPGIFLLMALESSFFPFPSEVVMIPAGYLAYQGQMHVVLVLIAGIGGSVAGALFNYWLAVHLGRAVLLRYGRYIFIKPETLARMEDFFQRHGEISTFNGRLIPAVRQYISLPAGLARMPLGRFALYTSMGAGLWMIILTYIGYFLGANENAIREYLHYFTIGAIIFVILSSVAYVIWRRRRAAPRQAGGNADR